MKVLIFAFLILSNCICILGQDHETKTSFYEKDPDSDEKIETEIFPLKNVDFAVRQNKQNRSFGEQPESGSETIKLFKSKDYKTKYTEPFFKKNSAHVKFDLIDEANEPDDYDKIIDSPARTKEKFNWKPALIESGIFLGIQHAFRMTQKKTTRELDGPFFRDWGRSVKSLNGWSDGNKFFTNYIAHPMQGGVTGRIFINNSDRAKKQEFGKSMKYWETRLKAMAWSAVWSTQFEIGPISEATLGNVGILGDPHYNKMAWVDFVITPTLGTVWVVGEDALDKYIMKNWFERKTSNRTVIKILRIAFAPTTSFANILRGKMPWYRENRLLISKNPLFGQ